MASEVGEGSGSDSSKKLIYDVFLSFRGKALRRKFIDHLHHALEETKIKTFHDTILPRGREIESELYKAIESSKLSIVTFCPDYATSEWCLDELAKIVECRDSNSHDVLPVFYNVEPSTVRHQKGTYKDAFDQHETASEHDKQKVKRWRECLGTVSDLSGLSLQNDANGYEKELIKLIIQDVLKLLGSVLSFEDVQQSWDAVDRALMVLNRRKDDVQLEVTKEEAKGKSVLYEVAGWIKEVVNVEDEANNLRQKSLDTSIAAHDVVEAIAKLAGRVEELKSQNFKIVATHRPRYASEIPLPPTIVTSRVADEVLGHLLNENIGVIGIYGLGGIGKTTILTELNNKLYHQGIDYVLYVTVSKRVSITDILNSIAEGIGINDEAWSRKNEEAKAKYIFQVLKTKRGFLLLDDLWEDIELHKIGISVDLSQENKFKIVLTSRSREICCSMGAEMIVEVRRLSREDSWDLFLKKAGQSVLDRDPPIPALAKKVCEKCCGLPLVLVIMGGIMSSKRTPGEWRVMLAKLKNMAKIKQVEKKVLSILKLSYDELEDDTIKTSFLYLWFDPLNTMDEVIELWLASNLLADRDSADVVYNALQNIGFIEVDVYNNYRLHDVVVELGLWICEKSQSIARYTPQVDCSGNRQADNKSEAETLFITGSKVAELAEPINCPNLTTLIMIRNDHLEGVANDFFNLMPRLRVIYLSSCYKLKNLPNEMWRLKDLCYLNFCHTGIENLPLRFGELKQLQFLELGYYIKEIPEGVLFNFKELRIMRIWGEMEPPTWLLRELESLSNLEDFRVELNTGTESYKFFTTSQGLLKCTTELTLWGDGDQATCHLPRMERLRSLSLSGWYRILMARKHVEITSIHIYTCKVLHDVSDLLLCTPNLKYLFVYDCPEMEALVTNNCIDENSGLFGRLEHLHLEDLPLLEYICPTPLQYPHLIQLHFYSCPKLKKLPFNMTNARNCKKFLSERSWFDQLDWESSETRHYFASKHVDL